jgi:hypothetical protein
MAKDKKTKKSNKAKDPGAKLIKEIGKQAEKFVELAKHPLVSDIIAAGLTALAASVRDGKGKPKAADQSSAKGAREDFTKTAQGLAGALAAKAAETVTSRLFDAPQPPAPTAAPTPPKAAAPRRGRPPGATAAGTSKPATATKPRATAAKSPSAASANGSDTPKPETAAKPAPAKRAPTKTPRATTRKPAAKASTRKPPAPKTSE